MREGRRSKRATIALATVRILQKEDETKNRIFYIKSFYVTQNEVLKWRHLVARSQLDGLHVARLSVYLIVKDLFDYVNYRRKSL